MRLRRVVFREMIHQKWNSSSALCAVILAVGTLAGAKTLLDAYESRATELLHHKDGQLKSRLNAVKADVRRAMAKLGFNVVILPEGQSLADWYAMDYASKTMPEQYVDRLREAELVTMRRPLAQLRRAIMWPETKWKVILVGRGKSAEAAGAAVDPNAERRSRNEPSTQVAAQFLDVPPPHSISVGHEIYSVLELEEGDDVDLMGRSFRIDRCLPREGSKDDITIWLPLDEAQQLLGEDGRINEILALGCQTDPEGIEKLRCEVARVLPETQVIQMAPESLAKAMAGLKVREKQRESLQRERAAQSRLRGERRRAAIGLELAIVVACGMWLAWLAWSNVEERRIEIGLWKAIGLSTGGLAFLFLGRWVSLGAIGASLGIVVGSVVGFALAEAGSDTPPAVGIATLLDPALFALAFLVAVVLSGMASGVASFTASRNDPAVILRRG